MTDTAIDYISEDIGEYQPGTCNIGPAEVRRRQQVGLLGLAGTVVLGALLVALRAPRWTRLSVALPAAGALTGFMQARCKFCTGYAMAGLQNMGELGDAQKIEDTEARTADRRRALAMQAVAAIGGIVVAVVFWRARL
jgi:hypothetical protein